MLIFILADTFSIPWKKTLAQSSHDDFISAADYLEKTVNHLMMATLSIFIESKVIQFKQIPQGVNFKVRIRIQAGKSTSDAILWYRWVKRAIDFSITEAGHAGNVFEKCCHFLNFFFVFW